MTAGAAVVFVRAPAPDSAEVRRAWDEWRAALADDPDAGWRGSAAGVTAAEELVGMVRTGPGVDPATSPAARTAWEGLVAALGGPPAVEATADVSVVGDASASGAGFVQFMRARVADRGRLEELEAAITDDFAALRPDFLAGIRAWTAPDRLMVVDFFSSEAEARAGEARPLPAGLRASFEEWLGLLDEVEWFDLPHPWVAWA